jgi:hypothetical protein
MLDGDRPIRNGELVREFILLPEAGTSCTQPGFETK